MIRLSFIKILPESSDKLDSLKGWNRLSEAQKILAEHKGVVFALDDGESIKAASVIVFDMGDEVLTTALRKLYLADLYADMETESEYKGMMLEYTVNQAAYMGYDNMSVIVKLSDLTTLKFFAYHGFDKIIRVDEKNGDVVLQRNVKAVMKCCGK